MRNRTLKIVLFTCMIAITVVSCKNRELIRPGDPINVAYDKAFALFEKEEWGDAARSFNTVTRIGRGTQFARDAQFYLAESYFNNKSWLLAASEYERFISIYPNDPRREEVDFKNALCYYHMSPRYQLDQTDTKKAIELFQLFNNRYPDSELVIEASTYIDELRNKLAHKYFDAADFYLRTDRFKAAIIYYDQIIELYPDTEWAERGLVKQISTYITYADNSVSDKQPERYQKALESYQKFLQLFPQSELRAEAENLRDEAQNKLTDITGDSGIAQSNSNSG